MAEIDPSIGLPSGAGTGEIPTSVPDDYLQVEPKTGAALQQAGAQATDLSKVFGQVQTDDVLNQGYQQLSDIRDKYMALNGQDALNAQASTQQQVDQTIQNLRSNLHSLDQLDAFDTNIRSFQFRYVSGAMAQHAADAQTDYSKGVLVAKQAQAVQNGAAVAGSTDPNALLGPLNDATEAAVRGTQIDGDEHDPSILQANVQRYRQDVVVANIQATAQKNPAMAEATYQKYSSLLDPDTSLKIQQQLKTMTVGPATDAIVDASFNLADAGTSGATAITPAQQSAQWNAESGGQQFQADGKTPVMSDKGAVGVAQILPTTAPQFAQWAGLPFDPEKLATNANYNKTLGVAGMNHYMAQTNGNYPLSLAMYNAGPNGQGVQHFAETGDPSQLPAETQTYIQKVTGQPLQANLATPAGGQSLDQIGANITQVADDAATKAETQFPDIPGIGDIARQKVMSRYASLRQQQTDEQSANLDVISNFINGQNVTDPTSVMSAGGQVTEAWNNLTSDQRDSALTMMNKNIPGNRTVDSPAAQQAVSYYTGLATTDPKSFLGTNFQSAAVLNLLTADQRTALMKQQSDILKGVYNGPKPADINDAVKLVEPVLNSAGIYSGDSPVWQTGMVSNTTKLRNQQSYTGAVGQLTQDITAFQQQNDRLPTPDETMKMAQRLVMKGTVGGKAEMLFQAEAGGKLDPNFLPDIPSGDLAAINRAYYQSYGQYPDQRTSAMIYLSAQAGTGGFLRDQNADVASNLPGGMNFANPSPSPSPPLPELAPRQFGRFHTQILGASQ